MRGATTTIDLVPDVEGSSLRLALVTLDGDGFPLAESDCDRLLHVVRGSGRIELGGNREQVSPGCSILVASDERARIDTDGTLELLVATVGPGADRHAPLGPRRLVVAPDEHAEAATGARSFRVELGPHNGSTRATLFTGFVPPGRAPWHYHLYDEIVWIPTGPGLLHLEDRVEELGPGATFRLRPRQVHIVENAQPEGEMTLIGIFTPAGSPAAAYLTPDVASSYRFSA